MRSVIPNHAIRQAETLLRVTAHEDDWQVRQARMEVEQALGMLRERARDYERLWLQARCLECCYE